MRKTQLLLTAACLAGAGGLNAQGRQNTDKDTKPGRQSEETCTTDGGRTVCRIFRIHENSALARRAAIGVEIQTTGSKRDTIGVFVSRVVPDGPAEKAGIVEGERIVSINGVDLRVAAADTEDSYTAGIAAHRLTREIAKLSPGSRVTLQVNSGGRTREVQVTTVPASELRKMRGGYGIDFPGMPLMRGIPMQMLREERRILTPGAQFAPPPPPIPDAPKVIRLLRSSI